MAIMIRIVTAIDKALMGFSGHIYDFLCQVSIYLSAVGDTLDSGMIRKDKNNMTCIIIIAYYSHPNIVSC
jgi:hypothetical protein